MTKNVRFEDLVIKDLKTLAVKVIWHEGNNVLALVEERWGWMPRVTILDEDFRGPREFISYPMDYLKQFGWLIIGEL